LEEILEAHDAEPTDADVVPPAVGEPDDHAAVFDEESDGCAVDDALFSGDAGSSEDHLVAGGDVPVAVPDPVGALGAVDPPEVWERPTVILTFHTPNGGKITYYPVGKRFEVTCSNKISHNNCRLQKRATMYVANHMIIRHPSQGRCLGFLYSWLEVGCTCANKKDHLDWIPSFVQRRHGRDMLKASEAGRAILQCERRKFVEEHDSEPEIAP
jgi:hypothetical protein